MVATGPRPSTEPSRNRATYAHPHTMRLAQLRQHYAEMARHTDRLCDLKAAPASEITERAMRLVSEEMDWTAKAISGEVNALYATPGGMEYVPEIEMMATQALYRGLIAGVL